MSAQPLSLQPSVLRLPSGAPWGFWAALLGTIIWSPLLLAGCGQGAIDTSQPDAQSHAISGVSCYSCHGDQYLAATNPVHSEATFPQACDECHSEQDWQTTVFPSHEAVWAREGVHLTIDCAGCHAGRPYAETPNDCAGCHQPDYDQTTAPDHALANLPTTCEDCHTASTWATSTLPNHDDFYPLVGRHQTVACGACHQNQVYKGTPTDCEGCHMANYDQTPAPSHKEQGMATTCALCHTPAGWIPTTFDHAATWPLLGKHDLAKCSACHKDGVYKGTSRDCIGCHQASFDETKSPDHAANGIVTTCETCHDSTDWSPTIYGDHYYVWPLEGKHEPLLCSSCHDKEVAYPDAPNSCVGCHLANWEGAKEPDHQAAGVGQACADCHTPVGWKPANFKHKWPITGAHLNAACSDCHTTQNYKETPSACAGCHQSNYDQTTTPQHAAQGIGTGCVTCHTTAVWTPTSFGDHDAYYPLEGKHLTANCGACHKNDQYVGTPKHCQACHQAQYDASTNPNHAKAGLDLDCKLCHAPSAWIDVAYEHTAKWPLTGKHTAVNCVDCHTNEVFEGANNACQACHLSSWEQTTEPKHSDLGMGKTCEECHDTESWLGAKFAQHDLVFPLTGKHQTAACSDCHSGGSYAGVPNTCVACHQAAYDGSTQPQHNAQGIGTGCATCHTAAGWSPTSYGSHDDLFPLEGKHQQAKCSACHVGEVYQGTASECAGCHQPAYDATQLPSHSAVGFGTQCVICHVASGWSPAAFPEHDAVYPLIGQHLKTGCGSCHTAGFDQATTPETCKGCHQASFDQTAKPNHAVNGIPTSCEQCHDPVGWTPPTFGDHQSFFPITGKHTQNTCADCHTNGFASGANSPTCAGCHVGNWATTTNPAHEASGIPQTCEDCHTSAGWKPASFDHQAVWPLTGKHAQAACGQCHQSGYTKKDTPATCVGCHLPQWQQTAQPAHEAAGIGQGCQDCHSSQAWKPATFQHDQIWPLTGKHLAPTCGDCHTAGFAKGQTPSDCAGCHQANYNQTTAPPHQAQGIVGACEQCHTEAGWAPPSYGSHSSFWVLKGAHANASCGGCHQNGVYKTTPKQCVSCHKTAYTKTSNPNHVTSGFPQTCQACHNETAWTPASFDHSGWPLSGKHAQAACGDCHKNGVYSGTPTLCSGCHLSNYNSTSNPKHSKLNLSKSCDKCHQNSLSWATTTFPSPAHNGLFPVYWGKHGFKNCSWCHKTSTWSTFTCTGCHLGEHNIGKMNAEHAGEVGGYQTKINQLGTEKACKSCHPQGDD